MLRNIFRKIIKRISAEIEVSTALSAESQLLLNLEYRRLVREKSPLPRIDEIGFKCHSQADEDGILLFIFSLIGVTNRLCAEICAGDGLESNTANLILNHGWHGLLVDGDRAKVERGKKFFAGSRRTYVYPPKYLCEWITRDSINGILKSNGFGGSIDMLSIDLDGVDYWIWEAISISDPRVVVVEYQDILGPDRAWTVPYSDNFSGWTNQTQGMPNFAGASLSAFVKLAKSKGYRLVGTNRYGYNAFFVKNGLADDLLPTIDAVSCFGHPKVQWGMRERFPLVEMMPWVEV